MKVDLSVSEVRRVITILGTDNAFRRENYARDHERGKWSRSNHPDEWWEKAIDSVNTLIEKLEDALAEYKPRTTEELAEFYNVPVEKPCSKCPGTMRLGIQVVDDEIPYPDTGDFELAQTCIIEFECNQCGETEEIGTKTKGSGILR